MTAYVNDEQKKEGAYGKAVKATLAATLAAGMVPAAAAFADDAQVETASEGDVELLANPSAAEAFSAGKVTAAQVYFDGKAFRNFNLNGKDSLDAHKGVSKMIVPTTVEVPSVGEVKLVADADLDKGDALALDPNYKVNTYAADKDGKPTGEALSEVINPGSYVTVVEAIDGEYKGGKVCVPFTINPANLGALSVFEVNPSNAADASDGYFEFTGDKLNLGIAGDGTVLEQGVDYEVTFKKAASNEAADVVNAGTYYAEVKGLGIYAGKEGKTAAFEVNKFDLTTATIEADDVIATNDVPTHPTRVVSAHGTVLDPELVSIELQKGQVFDAPGAYTFVASSSDDANIISTKGDDAKKFSINKIARAASFGYDDEAWKTEFVTDLSQKKPVVFDVTKVQAFDGESALVKGNADGNFKVQVFDANGADVTATVLADNVIRETGTYTVKVSVVTGAGNYNVGGTASATVKVTKGAIDADATAWVSYDGKVIEGNELDAEYDPKGGYAVNDFTFGVKDANGKDVATSDYTVKIVDQDGKEYKAGDTMKNAGTYSIVIESAAYDITNQTAVEFTIAPMALNDVKLGAAKTFGSFVYLPLKAEGYGVPAVPGTNWGLGIERNNGTEFVAVDEKNAEIKLVLEQYDAEAGVWKTVTTAKGEGQCRLTVAPLNSSVASNYVFASEAGTEVAFQVVDEGKLNFYDVLPVEGAWYFDVVDQAFDKNWIKGYNASDFFGPNDSITRADVCVIVARMAGVDLMIDREDLGTDLGYFDTPFDDVNGGMYYAEAIAWAANSGLVQGDGGTKNFRPDDQISREEFAAIMARYAEKLGFDVSADADALDGYADVDAVSGWAKDYMAWNVEAGIMGVGTNVLRPMQDISRAEVAAMVVRF